MELWVRSQDKERLCKVNNLFIKNFSICCSCNDENNDYDYLGVYSTKERALEVLDEIQRLITPEINYNPVIKREMKPEDTYARTTFERYETTIESLPCYVYEMPKE